jgi:oxygen-dependent protoporphyrinogen oxidase
VTDLFFVLARMLGAPLSGTPAGLDFLCKALADRLDVCLAAEVTAVERLQTGGALVSWQHNGTSHQQAVDGCVLAVPGPIAVKLYSGLDNEARAIITDRMVHVDTISARFALRGAPDIDCLAVVVPASECGGLATVVQEHLVAADCVPAGKGLLATFWSADWCAERMHLDDESLAELMLADLEQVLPGVTDTVEFSVIDRWSPSNPMFRLGNYRLVAELGKHLDPLHGVQLAGDYLGLPIVEGSVVSGRDAAARLGAAIRSRAGTTR